MENLENVKFNTERLQLEALSMKYLQEIYKELTDEVTKYLRVPTPKSIDQEINRINDSQEHHKKWTQINFEVTINWEFVGCCGYTDLNTPTPELWIWIKESTRGKWYGKEIVSGIINRLKDYKKFDYIIYGAHVDNVATQKIVRSFGGELQIDTNGNPIKTLTRKFDKSASFDSLEYRIYPNK